MALEAIASIITHLNLNNYLFDIIATKLKTKSGIKMISDNDLNQTNGS